ncbi:signal transduction histidine kinase [Paenibacillus castaneae]|uniref:sensor histidine kinase n=1 Tax=Paenibacillus castaneae TaxID=474957 RepID=UPI000C9C0755|nr:histidine kinase [Paenibacillus castaneae]NIK78279.1 signal transduction histidine kinase [Paenibacillus castaneae]
MAWRLKWNDWILYFIRTIGFISVIYFTVRASENITFPIWLLVVFITASYAVPLGLLQMGKKAYLIAELVMLAILVPYFCSVDHLIAGNLVLYTIMVGFYNERKMYKASGACLIVIALAGPVILLPEAPVSYFSIAISCIIYSALGYIFHFLLSAKSEIEHKNNIIEEQYRLLEQYAKQVEQHSVLKERNRISDELQGSISHTYTTLALSLESLRSELSTEREKRMISHVMDITKTGLEEVKRAVEELKPLEMKLSLNAMISLAIDEFESTGIEVLLRVKGEEQSIAKELTLLLVRCLHESISLPRREGHAAHIRVTV